ncbi:MAG: plasmid segregation actin-type ATPase ParM, partial [Lachnospiraceae bacterium]|nr:plasmid segregation actin-type ATPase ParM [Lachnospiraceae bacterium]
MDKNTIVIGIDHGWANMKTVSHLFTSGVKEITTE